jgi:hypothetical protein
MQPQPFANDDAAKRAFENAARIPGSVLNQSPQDFEFWRIGYFDDQTGILDLDLEFVHSVQFMEASHG